MLSFSCVGVAAETTSRELGLLVGCGLLVMLALNSNACGASGGLVGRGISVYTVGIRQIQTVGAV